MSETKPETHIHLVDLLLEGDNEAYAALYDAYAPMLYGVILHIVHDRKEAESLLEDCFLKIWQNISEYNTDKGRLATWLNNIARNTAIDFSRSKYFQQKLSNRKKENLLQDENEHTITQPAVDTLGLRQLVERLNPGCREVIQWMYFHGYTQQEISKNFGIPLGTVKSRTRTALKELRSFYQ